MNNGIQRPRFTVMPGPTIAEMEAGLKRWAATQPYYLTVETAGHSPQGLPVLLCRITDATVPDEDKQVALFTTNHTGLERNAASSMLKFIKWLISDDPRADVIRRRQIVLVMPACEPETYDSKSTDTKPYYTARSGKVYGGWTWDGPQDPANQPEAMAVKQVMDTYQPEVHQDVHGVWFAEQIMWESTAVSWASNLYRSYAPGIARLMDDAAEREGYLIGSAEEADGKIRATAPVPGAEHWFYGVTSKPNVVAGLYAYRQFHTISQTSEVGWDQSAIIRYRRLLEVGNGVWRCEHYPGYPANIVRWWGSAALAAWGKTAAERRRSRVELWRKLPQINTAMAHPEVRNSVAAFVHTSQESRARYASDPSIEQIFAKMKENPRFNGAALDEYLAKSPAFNAHFEGLGYDGPSEPIQHGMAIRLLLPYPGVKFTHLKLDGHDIPPSETDGYFVYHNPGTIVQVNIPPDKVQDFHVVTALFDTDVDRPSGFVPEDWQLV